MRRWTCGARSTGPAAICWGGNLKDQLAERRGLVLFYLLADDVFKSNSDMKNALKHMFLSIAEKIKKEELSVY